MTLRSKNSLPPRHFPTTLPDFANAKGNQWRDATPIVRERPIL
jgi:hypothetical protein